MRLFINILLLLLILISCSQEKIPEVFDAASGFVDNNYQYPDIALIPIEVTRDSDYDHFYLSDRFLFIAKQDTLPVVILLEFNRGLNNNKLLRSERDFSGYIFYQDRWTILPYTRARQDDNSLNEISDNYFGKFNWRDNYRAGKYEYQRRDVKFTLEFTDLKPVYNLHAGNEKQQTSAIGKGTLTIDSTIIEGDLFYESIQLEGYNKLVNQLNGIDHINYDWMTLLTQNGDRIIISSDSSSDNNRIYRNYLSLLKEDTLLHAVGSDNLKISSTNIRRDVKIYQPLALKKTVNIPELELNLDINLTERRFFFTSGVCLAIVEGELEHNKAKQNVWGFLYHIQKLDSSAEALK